MRTFVFFILGVLAFVIAVAMVATGLPVHNPIVMVSVLVVVMASYGVIVSRSIR